MCEVLVRVTPRQPGELKTRPDAGGILQVREDGWQWGRLELAGDGVLVVKLPGIPVSDIHYLTNRIKAGDGVTLERHRYVIGDMAQIISKLPDGDITKGPITVTKPGLLALIQERAAVDPRIIG